MLNRSISERWFTYYRLNHKRIWQLTLINVTLTILSEFIVREAIASILGNDWSLLTNKVNSQSLINIFMTVVVTNIGGIALFIPKKNHRFILFCLISLFASSMAQGLTIHFGAESAFSIKRLIFDLVYAGTLKFFFFEYFRSELTIANRNIFQLFLTRSKSDLAMTLVKTCILGLIGLRH